MTPGWALRTLSDVQLRWRSVLTLPFSLAALWQDIKDTWRNTLMNAQNQIRLAEYHTCGQFLTPDMLTVGMGGQTAGEYRAQFYLWAILGAPLILSNDIRTMAKEDVRLDSHLCSSCWNCALTSVLP